MVNSPDGNPSVVFGTAFAALSPVLIVLVFPLPGCGRSAGVQGAIGICGNGIREVSEACDGADLGGLSCETLGLGTGELGCTGDCRLDTSGCPVPEECGNGVVERAEECDGEDVAGQSCEGLGFAGGELACGQGCAFDVSGCLTCGNNVVDGAEVCDGEELSGTTCIDLGFYGGELACLPDCMGFDTSSCGGWCGDGRVDGPEECDDGNADNTDGCVGECRLAECGDGFLWDGVEGCDDGNLDGGDGCSPFCVEEALPCGNGTVDGTEVCDGADLGGADCLSIPGGFECGTLVCEPTCDGTDNTGCRGGTHWATHFGGIDLEHVWSVAVDANHNVYVTGGFRNAVDFGGGFIWAEAMDVFLVKYDGRGRHLWSQGFGGPGDEIAWDVAVDPAGNVIIAGHHNGEADFGGGPLGTYNWRDDVFLAKYTPGGQHLWSHTFGQSVGGYDELGRSVTTDATGNVILAGHYESVDFGGGWLPESGTEDIFVAKFSPGGQHLWSLGFAGPGYDLALGVGADTQGNIWATGHFAGALDFGGGVLDTGSNSGADMFLLKLDPGGGHLFSERFGTPFTPQSAWDVAVDANDNVYVTGFFRTEIDLGGGPLASAGDLDGFVASFDAGGNHRWSRRFGDVGLDEGFSITVDDSGRVVVGGFFVGTADFGGGPHSAVGETNGFVAAYDDLGGFLFSRSFPTPATGPAGDSRVRGVGAADGFFWAGGCFAADIDIDGYTFQSAAGSVDCYVARLSVPDCP